MGRRGIDMVLLKTANKKIPFVRIPVQRPWKETWVENINVDKKQDGTMSTFWKKLVDNVIDPKDVLKSMIHSTSIIVKEIEAFRIDGNLVWVANLYPNLSDSKFYCSFKRDGNKLLLHQVGCKKINEILEIGGPKVLPNVPMIIAKEKETFSLPNL